MSDGGFEDGADDGFWNIFLMSILGLAGAAAEGADDGTVDEDAAVEIEAVDDEVVEVTTDDLDDIDALPLTWPDAGTDPKDFTLSDLSGGAAAGDEDIDAEASSIDPNVTAEPVERRGISTMV